MKINLFITALLLQTLASAQTNISASESDRLAYPRTARRYYTQQNYLRLAKLDKDMDRKRAFLDLQARNNPGVLDSDVVIPVVVHILYPAGAKNLPTESDARAQLDIASKDFRQTAKIIKHEADTREGFADKNGLDERISFCLAKTDPNGKPTTGVLVESTKTAQWAPDDKMKAKTTGGSDPWDTERYLNIWAVNLPDSAAGYAQMPAGPAATDGIVIDWKYFGQKDKGDKGFPFTEGRTLTHLLGSYLNLYELWSETVPCGDDGVDDTPIHNAPTAGNVRYKFVSTCGNYPVVQSMNFMDNTNDEVQYMFTEGQKKRLQSTVAKNGIRAKLALAGKTLAGCSKSDNLAAADTRRKQESAIAAANAGTYRVFPNPATDVLNIETTLEKDGVAGFTVFNAQGAVILSRSGSGLAGSQFFTVPCKGWAAGVYFVVMKVGDTFATERVVLAARE